MKPTHLSQIGSFFRLHCQLANTVREFSSKLDPFLGFFRKLLAEASLLLALLLKPLAFLHDTWKDKQAWRGFGREVAEQMPRLEVPNLFLFEATP